MSEGVSDEQMLAAIYGVFEPVRRDQQRAMRRLEAAFDARFPLPRSIEELRSQGTDLPGNPIDLFREG